MCGVCAVQVRGEGWAGRQGRQRQAQGEMAGQSACARAAGWICPPSTSHPVPCLPVPPPVPKQNCLSHLSCKNPTILSREGEAGKGKGMARQAITQFLLRAGRRPAQFRRAANHAATTPGARGAKAPGRRTRMRKRQQLKRRSRAQQNTRTQAARVRTCCSATRARTNARAARVWQARQRGGAKTRALVYVTGTTCEPAACVFARVTTPRARHAGPRYRCKINKPCFRA